ALSRSVIVDKHGGAISCRNVPGQGACFSIRLPLQETGATT
ncbi:MAG: HAMP domain-containing histidine kinase, partial [Planctomycetes bacterium]|nr:HAMP domain-containing histidine kinase [Planctomycetota bacterium]